MNWNLIGHPLDLWLYQFNLNLNSFMANFQLLRELDSITGSQSTPSNLDPGSPIYKKK